MKLSICDDAVIMHMKFCQDILSNSLLLPFA